MAITQFDLDSAKGAADTAFKLMNIEWNSQPVKNSTGYSVLSWLQELQKCDPNATITRNSNYVVSALSFDKNKFTSNTCNNRLTAFNKALTEYNLLQNDYNAKLNAYNLLLTQYNQQGVGGLINAQSWAKRNQNLLIASIIVVAIIGIGVYFYKKSKHG